MFTNKIEPNYTGITLEDLAAIEKEYDFKFPEDLKDFCFSIRETDYGCIYFLESDNLDEENPENSVIKVGENFTDFINSME